MIKKGVKQTMIVKLDMSALWKQESAWMLMNALLLEFVGQMQTVSIPLDHTVANVRQDLKIMLQMLVVQILMNVYKILLLDVHCEPNAQILLVNYPFLCLSFQH